MTTDLRQTRFSFQNTENGKANMHGYRTSEIMVKKTAIKFSVR